jgi:molybdopterin adenylyltransferase
MVPAAHHHADVAKARCTVITVSDSRSAETDESGKLVAELLTKAGQTVVRKLVVKDDVEQIREVVLAAVEAGHTDAVVLTGGTGIGLRDVTPEALAPLYTCQIDGFGEKFRELSFAETGPRALLSRATAGTIHRTIVFSLPGSTAACRLGLEQLVLPLLPHAVGLLQPHQPKG